MLSGVLLSAVLAPLAIGHDRPNLSLTLTRTGTHNHVRPPYYHPPEYWHTNTAALSLLLAPQ